MVFLWFSYVVDQIFQGNIHGLEDSSSSAKFEKSHPAATQKNGDLPNICFSTRNHKWMEKKHWPSNLEILMFSNKSTIRAIVDVKPSLTIFIKQYQTILTK